MQKLVSSVTYDLYFNPSLPRLTQKVSEIDFQELVPHRTEKYLHIMKKIDSLLLKILGNENFVPILLSGNGTLANEIMVANLTLSSKQPAVIINGEFGERLYRQCLKYNSKTIAIDFGFANNIDLSILQEKLKNIDALFFVALETSTGVINPVKEISLICEKLDIQIGIDAISAIGAEKIDFSSTHLSFISASSGKNLASIADISIVFVRNSIKIESENSLPTTIDLAYLLNSKSSLGLVKNTLSYFLVKALHISLNELINTIGLSKQYKRYIGFREMIINELKNMNIILLENCNATNVLSFHCPETDSWNIIKKVLAQYAISVYYQVSYLREQNIFQIAYMGFYSKQDVEKLLHAFSVATKVKVTKDLLEGN